MRRTCVLLPVLSIALLGCGSSSEGVMPKAHDVLTAQELENSPAKNAYEAIRLHRPMFLASRRTGEEADQMRTAALPAVYLNGMYYGEIESLRTIHVMEIQEVRYLDAREATMIYGTGHIAGAILVTTRVQ